MGIFYLDGQYIDSEKATVSVQDLAVLRGYGIFDFLKSYNRKPFHLEDHINRFRNSAKLIGLPIKESNEELAQIIQTTIDKNPQYKEVNVRFLYTGGVSPDGVTPIGNGKLMVMVTDKHQLPDWWYTDGVKVITIEAERSVPGAKSLNYLGAILGQQEAGRKGAAEALYVYQNGNVTEGTTTNVFGFKDGVLYTPDNLMLPGITRKVLLEILPAHFKVVKQDISKAQLFDFDEVFITASNKEIVPVIQIDDKMVGNGKPGENTKKVMAIFKAYTDEFAKN